MGIGGTLEFISDVLYRMKRGKKKKKQIQTVNLKVKMDCDGCARKMKHVLKRVRGARTVEVDKKQQKVSVTGYVDAKRVLAAAKATKKKVEIWPYVPVNVELNPYVSNVYDKKAPPNMVRKTQPGANPPETTIDFRYATLFSDDNPNACSIM